jgi:hypothetical protein
LIAMGSLRATGRWLRIAVAMAFGFMSLGHGPVMTFAHAGAHPGAHAGAPEIHKHVHTDAPQHHGAMHGHHHDGHQTLPEQPGDPMDSGDHAVCNAFGCFITVSPALVSAPTVSWLVLGKLAPPSPGTGAPALSEPTDPPPRLHG